MAELDERAQAVLDAARSGFSPSPDDLVRLRRRLDVPPPDGGGNDPGPGPASSGWQTWAVAAAVVIAIVGSAGLLATHAARPDPSSPPDVPVAKGPDEPRAPEPVQPVSIPTVAPPTGPLPEETVEVKKDVNPSPPRTPRRSPAPPPAPGDDLGRQLELMARARDATKLAQWSIVRQTCRTYLEEFDDGAFVEEAATLSLIADCSTDSGTDAQDRARAYVARDGMFAARVKRACLVPPPSVVE